MFSVVLCLLTKAGGIVHIFARNVYISAEIEIFQISTAIMRAKEMNEWSTSQEMFTAGHIAL